MVLGRAFFSMFFVEFDGPLELLTFTAGYVRILQEGNYGRKKVERPATKAAKEGHRSVCLVGVCCGNPTLEPS